MAPSEHPLVQAARRSTQCEDDVDSAAEVAEWLDRVIAEALAEVNPEIARGRLGAAIASLYWATTRFHGIAPAQAWIESTHRTLRTRAVVLFGATEAATVVRPMSYEPLPTPARSPGPRTAI
jgi:hypothetical protein